MTQTATLPAAAARGASADSLEAAAGPAEFTSVHACNLKVGTRLRIPILDGRDVLLLAEGKTITPTFLQHLRARGIAEVKVHHSELARVYACQPMGTAQSAPPEREGYISPEHNVHSDQLDAEIQQGGHLGLPPQGEAFANELVAHGTTAYDAETLDLFVQNHSQAVQQIDSVLQALANGKGLNVDSLASVADEAMTDLAKDSDLFACLGVNPYSGTYPARHSMHTCMLAISIGTQLALDRQTLKELAIGCLVHDAGMLQINEKVFRNRETVDRITFLEVTKHPVIVFDMMKDMRLIPSRSAFIAYQMHERCNGSGYPRRRSATQIHFLSKVAAVADVFIALVAPRPHRPGMVPYRAIEKIIRGANEGLYEPMAVRALLRTVSLFPIGSYMELSNGQVGRVIRANGEVYHRPIIEAWEPGLLQMPAEIINLAERDDLKIVRPLAQLETKPKPAAAEDNWE